MNMPQNALPSAETPAVRFSTGQLLWGLQKVIHKVAIALVNFGLRSNN